MNELTTDRGLLYAEAQQSVVGSMLIDPRCCGEVVRQLREEDFSIAQLRTVFAAAKRLWLDKKAVDPVALLAETGQEYAETIREAMKLTPTAANAGLYARIVREEAALLAIRETSEKLSAARRLEDARELLANAENLALGNPNVKAVGIQEALGRGYSRACDRDNRPPTLNWGFSKLNDRVRCGLGKFVVLAADSSVGKTSFALQLAWNIASRGMRVGFYSVETDEEDLTDRITAQRNQTPMDRIMAGDLQEQEWKDWLALIQRAGELHLELIDASDMSLEEIRADILYRRLDVVFIDYLQLLDGRGSTAMEQVRWISKYTHKMARTLGVTVIGLSQVTVPADAPDKWVPTLESLRESKQLKNDADVVFLLYLHKQSQRDGVRWISVAKNKMGRLGRMAMEFDGDRQWFSVTKPPPDDPPPPAKGKKAPQYTQPPAVEDIPDDDPRQEQIREVLKDAGW